MDPLGYIVRKSYHHFTQLLVSSFSLACYFSLFLLSTFLSLFHLASIHKAPTKCQALFWALCRLHLYHHDVYILVGEMDSTDIVSGNDLSYEAHQIREIL